MDDRQRGQKPARVFRRELPGHFIRETSRPVEFRREFEMQLRVLYRTPELCKVNDGGNYPRVAYLQGATRRGIRQIARARAREAMRTGRTNYFVGVDVGMGEDRSVAVSRSRRDGGVSITSAAEL